MGGITVIQVVQAVTKRDLVEFMEFPLKLYRDSPYYVPDILSSQVADMQPDKNPAFEYCQARCFLARRDGETVGRIACIHNPKANEKFKKNYLTISHIDFIDDDEVVDALFGAAYAYGAEFGCVAVHGPLGFTDMDREGMLVEGFDRKSLFYTYYNHPYYVTQMERLGFVKEADWIELRIKIPDRIDEKIEKLADFVKARKKLRVIGLGDEPIQVSIRNVFKLYNEVYSVLFGMVPLTEKQISKYVGEFRPMVDRRTTSLVYDDKGELVAFGVCCPALDDAMRACKGRTVPFGWIPILRALKGKNDTVDLLLIGIRPDLQGQGVNAVILDDMQKKLIPSGFKYAETGPMLEINDRILSQWSRYETEQHKRRRCWVKQLAPDGAKA